jgi:DNA-binding SARP family transcriptional activator
MNAQAGTEGGGGSGLPTRDEKPEAVRVWLLDGFRVTVGSRIIEKSAWRLRKAAALVKVLALAPGHHLHREQAIELLWPNSGRKAASNNLRQALHVARNALDSTVGSRYLASEDESLALCPAGSLWVDVDAFEETAVTARRSRDPATYRAALDLCAGDLLPQDRYEAWAADRREHLRRLYLELLVELAALYEERGEFGEAVEALRRAIVEEPTNEEAYADLMRAHVHSGRPGDALAQYERLRDALLNAWCEL